MSLEYRMEVAEKGEEYAVAVGSMDSMNALLSGSFSLDPHGTIRVYEQKTDELVFELCPTGLSELA